MASRTLPEFYNYAKVMIQSAASQEIHDPTSFDDKRNRNGNIRYFWDGAMLNNTLLREPLHAHQEYWKDIENKNGSDKYSHYDENITRLIDDYSNFVIEMKELLEEAFSKVENKKDKGVLNRKLKDILLTKTSNKDRKCETRIMRIS
jgi:hypothetical protein